MPAQWLCLLALLVTLDIGKAQPSVVAERSERRLTVYQNRFAFVHDRWRVQLPAGHASVLFPGIPATAEPASIQLRLSPGELLWQRFHRAPSSGEELLAQLRGRTVRFVSADGQQVIEGTLLHVTPTYAVLRTPAGTLLLPSPTQYRVLVTGEVPGTLPTASLEALLRSSRAAEATADASFVVRELGWQMEYTLDVPPRGATLTLCGFARLFNESEVSYDSVRVSLIAGDVPLRTERIFSEMAAPGAPMVAAKASSEAVQPLAFEGFYRYDLPHVLSVHPGEQLLIPLIDCSSVRFQRLYRVESAAGYTGRLGVAQLLRMSNAEADGLGIPLPAGSVRVYSGSGSDSLGLLGMLTLPETPVGDTITLALGTAFDLKVYQRLLQRRDLPGNAVEETYQLSILNALPETVSVEILFRLRWDQQNWQVTSSSHPYWRHDATTLGFRIPARAEGETTLRFTLQSQYPTKP
jgi:hypothetical protein